MRKLINLILSSKLLLPFAIFCTLLIFYLSLADISDLPKVKVSHIDKLYHLIAYFVLNTVWLLAIIPHSTGKARTNILISLGIVVFGIVVEIFQHIWTDYRTFDVYDILANSSGILVSYLCFEIFKKRIQKNINTN